MFYLRYRPQRFEDLDNVRVRETLGEAVLNNNFAHAYMLLGTRGSGKTTTARLIAKTVNCLKRKKGEEPCNSCDSCVAITQGRSLDVIEIDGASNTGVEDIRDLREKVRLAPTSSKYKVYIIDEVHMLSTSAFNALLKTLEEPPEHVIFILATTDSQKVPETIMSRCLVYDFGKASQEEVKKALSKVIKEEKLAIEPEAIDVLAQRAGGSFRDAHKMLQQLADLGRKISVSDVGQGDFARKIVASLAKKDAGRAFTILEEYAAGSGKMKELLGEIIAQLHQVLLGEEKEFQFSRAEVEVLLRKLVEGSAMLRDSPVPQLPLELVVAEYCGEEKKITVATKVQENKKEEKTAYGEKWPEVLNAVKSRNTSLVALLRASRPKEMEGGFLVVEVFYKFHKDKLSEGANREVLEQVLSDIMGQEIKVKFVLGGEK